MLLCCYQYFPEKGLHSLAFPVLLLGHICINIQSICMAPTNPSATMAKPLCALQRKGSAFIWSTECQEAFEKIMDRISSNLKLVLYDPNADTYLNTDMSGVGISADLSQNQNGKEMVITCKLHMLQPAPRNYSTLKQEACAIVWGTEAFDKFLWGRPFTIHTNHRAQGSDQAHTCIQETKSTCRTILSH